MSVSKCQIVWVITLLVSFGCLVNIKANIVHVSPTGNDLTGNGGLISPFKTIQRAIDASVTGDTVLAAEGIYHERISFKSRALTLASWYLVSGDTLKRVNTVINADSSGLPPGDTLSALRLINLPADVSVIGLTIMGSPAEGILSFGQRVHVLDCVLIGNGIRVSGGFDFFLTNSRLIGCGLSCGSYVTMNLRSSVIDGLTDGALSSQLFADSCTFIDIQDLLVQANSCHVLGDIRTDYSPSTFRLKQCVVKGAVNTFNEIRLLADSCDFQRVSCGQESDNQLQISLVRGSIIISPRSQPVNVVLSHCTTLDTIGGLLGQAGIYIRIDSSNVSLPVPIDFQSNWKGIQIHCSNIYAGGGNWYTGAPDSSQFSIIDTANVTSFNPEFCNPALGDFEIFNTSPCAPANNACGILLGATEIGCTATCGDCDNSGQTSISDVVYLINYIFAGGSEPLPYSAGDADCDELVSISDAVYLINYIFAGGGVPCASC